MYQHSPFCFLIGDSESLQVSSSTSFLLNKLYFLELQATISPTIFKLFSFKCLVIIVRKADNSHRIQNLIKKNRKVSIIKLLTHLFTYLYVAEIEKTLIYLLFYATFNFGSSLNHGNLDTCYIAKCIHFGFQAIHGLFLYFSSFIYFPICCTENSRLYQTMELNTFSIN